jgi:general secretion pathway protein J
MSARGRKNDRESGFTLIEALVALALTGLVLSALATLTAQFLPNWNRGIDRIQHSELIGISMQRIAADLSSAEFVPADNDDKPKPLFDGSPLAVTFVRTAIGPNAGIGLDVVRIGEISDHGTLVTVRTRADFAPVPRGASPSEQFHLSNPVVLLRAPLRLSFAYAGPDHLFRDNWHDAEKLPVSIRLTVRNGLNDHVLAVSTVTPVHIDAPASASKSDDGSTNGSKGIDNGDGNSAVGGEGKRGS